MQSRRALFGISLPIVQIAGGLVISNTGGHMLNDESGGAAMGSEPATVETTLQRAFYPLTPPLTVGSGCISVTVAFGANVRQQSTVARIDNLPPFLRAIARMAVVCILLAVCFQHAGKLAAVLGPSGTDIVVRLSAFLRLALGVQIVWNGCSSSVAAAVAKAPAT